MIEKTSQSEGANHEKILEGEELANIMFWSFALSRGRSTLQRRFFEYIALHEPTWVIRKKTREEMLSGGTFRIIESRLKKMMESQRHVSVSDEQLQNSFMNELRSFSDASEHVSLISDTSLAKKTTLENILGTYIQEDENYLSRHGSDAGVLTLKHGKRQEQPKGFFKVRRSFLYDYTLGGDKLPPSAPAIFQNMFEDLKRFIESEAYKKNMSISSRVSWDRIVGYYKKEKDAKHQ